MLWTVLLPIKLTLCLFAVLVALVTLLAPVLKWKRGTTFLLTTILAGVAFIPSCAGIMKVDDAHRFGIFEFSAFADVRDSRIERYLPRKTRNIVVEKSSSGHCAKYTISESELLEFLDGLWNEPGQSSAIDRDDFGEGASVTEEDFQREFGRLGWPPLSRAALYHSPVQSNWAGAIYFFDRNAGIAYHRAGCW